MVPIPQGMSVPHPAQFKTDPEKHDSTNFIRQEKKGPLALWNNGLISSWKSLVWPPQRTAWRAVQNLLTMVVDIQGKGCLLPTQHSLVLFRWRQHAIRIMHGPLHTAQGSVVAQRPELIVYPMRVAVTQIQYVITILVVQSHEMLWKKDYWPVGVICSPGHSTGTRAWPWSPGHLHSHKLQGLSHGHSRKMLFGHVLELLPMMIPAYTYLDLTFFEGFVIFAFLALGTRLVFKPQQKTRREIYVVSSQIMVPSYSKDLHTSTWYVDQRVLGQIFMQVFRMEPSYHSELQGWSGFSFLKFAGRLFFEYMSFKFTSYCNQIQRHLWQPTARYSQSSDSPCRVQLLIEWEGLAVRKMLGAKLLKHRRALCNLFPGLLLPWGHESSLGKSLLLLSGPASRGRVSLTRLLSQPWLDHLATSALQSIIAEVLIMPLSHCLCPCFVAGPDSYILTSFLLALTSSLTFKKNRHFFLSFVCFISILIKNWMEST